MFDKQWLASPLEGDRLSFGDVIKLDFDLRQGQDISTGRQGGDKLRHYSLG